MAPLFQQQYKAMSKKKQAVPVAEAAAGTANIEHAESANARRIFEQYPSCNKLYYTSDGVPFLNENNATNHARQLDDKQIKIVNRQEV